MATKNVGFSVKPTFFVAITRDCCTFVIVFFDGFRLSVRSPQDSDGSLDYAKHGHCKKVKPLAPMSTCTTTRQDLWDQCWTCPWNTIISAVLKYSNTLCLATPRRDQWKRTVFADLLILGADRIVCSLLRIIRLLQGLLRANLDPCVQSTTSRMVITNNILL